MAENQVAPMHQKKQATAQQAEAVADALMKVFDQQLFNWELPRVMVDTWEHGRTVVVWEEGPYGWTWVFPCGGMLGGSRWEVPEAQLPKGVWVEPNDGCVVSVYQEVAERQSKSGVGFIGSGIGHGEDIDTADRLAPESVVEAVVA